jgi:hypothetical protein
LFLAQFEDRLLAFVLTEIIKMCTKAVPLCFVFIFTSVLSENSTIFSFVEHGATIDVNLIYTISGGIIPTLRRDDIANIQDVTTLKLIDNDLVTIEPGAFHNLPKLKTLKISRNDVEKIEAGVFNTLTNLTELDLSENEIHSIATTAFHNMTSLNSLNLTNNKLTQLDLHWFDYTPSLQSLRICQNQLTEVPARAFTALKSKLDLSIFLEDNYIEKIDKDAFQGLDKVTILSLTDNLIACVDDEDFDKVFVADVTEVAANSWKLECRTKIEAWAKGHNKTIKF